MSREEFMRELEYLLSDIPEEEKADAISYYRDYLEEAGPEGEAAAIAEYGSPERIAAIIRSELSGNLEDGGEFTERGYEDERFKDPNYEVIERYDLPEASGGTEEAGHSAGSAGQRGRGAGRKGYEDKPLWTNRVVKIVLWAVLIIAAAPVLLGAGGGLLGILGGLSGLFVGAVFFVGAITAALLIAAVVMLIVGIVHTVTNPLSGSLLIGIALLVLGLGLCCLALSFAFYGKFLPYLVRSVVDGIGRLFHNRRERT